MRKAFAAALGAALVGGLVVASISGGATARVDNSARGMAITLPGAQYKGTFKDAGPGTKIAIKAKLQNGEPTAIKKMIYEGYPSQCGISGPQVLSGGWTLAGVRVNDRRKFKAIGNDGGPPGQRSSLRFTGKFNRSFSKVRGKFQTTSYFPKGPKETCVGETKRYVAR